MKYDAVVFDLDGTLIDTLEDLMDSVMKIAQGRLCCPTLDQIGAAALYRLDRSYYDKARKILERALGENHPELVGTYNASSFILGESAIYKGFNIHPNINSLFSNHLAIFGNSGSGKSCGVARIVQNLFSSMYQVQYNAK